MNSPKLSSPLRSLKAKPELIASEFVNLTPETVAAFLRCHRWRLLFPTRTVATAPLPNDALSLDPITGEPTVLKTWKRAEPIEAKEADSELRPCEHCKKITKHVLADIEDKETPGKVHHLYVCEPCRNSRMQEVRNKRAEISKRQEEATLLKWAALLRGMWERGKAAEARQAIEQIFAAERPAVWNENLQRWGKTLPLERSAVQITRRGFTFQRRDLLDAVAWTILQASRRGFLRRCKDHGCQAPLFVAMHPRQVYCFACGVEAEKRRKRNWARKSRSSKRAPKRRAA